MAWASTSSTDLQRHTQQAQEREERSKMNVTCKVEKPDGTRQVRPGQWWWMGNKKAARKSLSSTPTLGKTESLRRPTGWCISTILASMRRREKGSLWYQRYFIKHSQGNVTGQIGVPAQQVKEVGNCQMVEEETVEVGVALPRKLFLLTEMKWLLLLLVVLIQWQASLMHWTFNNSWNLIISASSLSGKALIMRYIHNSLSLLIYISQHLPYDWWTWCFT